MLLLLHQVQVVIWVENRLLRQIIVALNLGIEVIHHLWVEDHLGRFLQASLRVYLVPLLATLR